MKKLILAVMLAALSASADTRDEIGDPTDSLPPQAATETAAEGAEMRVAAVIRGSHRGALAAADAIASKTSDPEVKAFAEHMRMERQELADAFDGLTELRGLPADGPADSRGDDFMGEGQAAAEQLEALSGTEADRAFLDHAADAAERLMKRIDEVASTATDPRMASYFSRLRSAAERDREIATALRSR